jgi:phosphoribosyl-AMP cyclohydrolase
MNEKEGMTPCVVQDVKNNNVLMLAYMNDESLEQTKKTGYMHYWSRSPFGRRERPPGTYRR